MIIPWMGFGLEGELRGVWGFSCTARKLASWDSWGLGCVRGAYLRRSSLHCSASRLHDSALWFVIEIWICLVVVYDAIQVDLHVL